MANLLDRALGDLTLRELAELGKVAEAVRDALTASVSPAPVELPTARPVVKRIAAPVRKAAKPVAVTPAPTNGNGGHAGPGTGRKACPKCHIVCGSRCSVCDSCGHRFLAAA